MAKPVKKAKKVHINLTLSPDALQLGRGIAGRENRSFSNLLETLIRRAAQLSGSPEIHSRHDH